MISMCSAVRFCMEILVNSCTNRCEALNLCLIAKTFKEAKCGEVTEWQCRPNGRHGVSNHQPLDCLHNRLSRRRSKKTSKLRVTGLCAGNSPMTGVFPAQRASNAENVSIWRCLHGLGLYYPYFILASPTKYQHSSKFTHLPPAW